MKIGIVDLDTSHPQAWVPIIRDLGHEIVAVCDGGTVHDAGAAARFAAQHGIPAVCDGPADMAGLVDAAIVHSVNWDLHVERARPFAAAGKAILIDKPMAGRMSDISQLLAWERAGVRIAGGSSLRCCEEVQAWQRERDPADRVVTALAGCGVDDFNYGIHAYSLMLAIMGPGLASVRSAGVHLQHLVELRWRDGRRGCLSVGETAGYLPFYATIVSEREVVHLRPDADRLYRSFLSACLPYLAGEAAAFPPLGELLLAERTALAARRSLLEGGRTVELDELRDVDGTDTDGAACNEAAYDGTAFAAQYRMKARGTTI